MASEFVKGGVKTSFVVGAVVMLIVLLIATVIAPIAVGIGWYVGAISFEPAVILLLVLACYLGGIDIE